MTWRSLVSGHAAPWTYSTVEGCTVADKIDSQSSFMGTVAVVLAIGLYLLASERFDQARQIRDLRSTIQNSMTPAIRLGEMVPGETPALEFMDHPCTEDCSGHLAGWQWAARHGVVRETQCDGSNSQSFAEGCRVYLWRMGYGPEPN